MAIAETVEILEHQSFIQGDGRDPLGIWVARHGITGDATGGSIKVGFRPRSTDRLFTCYDVNLAGIAGGLSAADVKLRLLTNLPDADIAVGVQAYASLRVVGSGFFAVSGLTAPIGGLNFEAIPPNQRFLLLFANQDRDPILEVETAENIDAATYSFEAYGYFWDRQVVNVPGGLRHPGQG